MSEESGEEFPPLGTEGQDLSQTYANWEAEVKAPAPDLPEEEPHLDEMPEPPPEESKPKVPRDKTFDEMSEGPEANMREALADMGDIAPTEQEKTMYLKGMLNDEPIQLSVMLCGGQVEVKIRSRSAWEQTCLHAAISRDFEEKLISTDMPSILLQMQRYGAALMLVGIGGNQFQSVQLSPEEDLEECVEALRVARKRLIDPMSMPRWTMALNALRVFESKMARMGTECLNENFWTPADSSST